MTYLRLNLTLTILVSMLVNSASAAVPDEVQAVFVDNGCLNCHGTSGGLSLDDAQTSEDQLVDITANCNTARKRVVPGDPANSVLYQKISSTNPDCGGSMPPGGPLISQADQDTIFNWILAIGPAAQFGLIQFAEDTVSTQEQSASVSIVVNREQGTQGSVSVDYIATSLPGDSASSPDDFIEQTGTLNFADGVASMNITVMQADDAVFEGAEEFSVTLDNAQGGAVLGSRSQVKVTIVDDEVEQQPGTFFFSATNYQVNESAASLEVTILRSFGGLGEVSVELSTQDGTATSGADYSTVLQRVVFAEGVQTAIVSVPIIDDSEQEGDEQFVLRLANPAGGANIAGTNPVSVTIVDDEGSNNGGDTGGGGTNDGNQDNSGGSSGGTTQPGEEAAYTPAGSANWYMLFLLWLPLIFRAKKAFNH